MKYLFPRENEVRAIEAATSDPRKRQILIDVIDVAITTRSSGVLSEAGLATIVTATRESDEAVWSRAGAWLIDFASTYPSAATAILELIDEPAWRVRFNLVALASRAPTDLALSMLARSLRDRSVRVRRKAADAAFSCDFPEATAILEAALAVETDPSVRALSLYYLPLMKGEPVIDGDYEVFRTPGGGIDSRPKRV